LLLACEDKVGCRALLRAGLCWYSNALKFFCIANRFLFQESNANPRGSQGLILFE